VVVVVALVSKDRELGGESDEERLGGKPRLSPGSRRRKRFKK